MFICIANTKLTVGFKKRLHMQFFFFTRNICELTAEEVFKQSYSYYQKGNSLSLKNKIWWRLKIQPDIFRSLESTFGRWHRFDNLWRTFFNLMNCYIESIFLTCWLFFRLYSITLANCCLENIVCVLIYLTLIDCSLEHFKFR